MQATYHSASALVLFGAMMLSANAAVPQGEKRFVKSAIRDNYATIQMGRLAAGQGSNDEIKAFGRIIERDCENANAQLLPIANRLLIPVPTGPGAQQAQEYQALKRRFGLPFDRRFLSLTAKEYGESMVAYWRHTEGNDDTARYARAELPVLWRHGMTARALVAASASPEPDAP